MEMVTESQDDSGWKGPERSLNSDLPAMEEHLPPVQAALSPDLNPSKVSWPWSPAGKCGTGLFSAPAGFA